MKRIENVVGWYHSHPGYGCWLSGIDVDTQMNNQRFQDPFVAVVVRPLLPLFCRPSSLTPPAHAPQIDPNRTISAGKVDIGAFRTYPKDFTPAHHASSSSGTANVSSGSASAPEYQSIPLSKIEDFGVHASQYYPLEVEVFRSSLDSELLGLLWNKYWVNTLSQSALISVRSRLAS